MTSDNAPPKIGVRIGPADPLEPLLGDLGRLAFIAIEFPGPSEGRGYTQARLLRERHGFSGELRAVGHVKRDQLFLLRRCGFDAFELSPGEDIDAALRAFDDFDTVYQPALDTDLNFKRRSP